MGWEHIGENDVVTRKDHRCFGCNEKFPKGTHMVKRDGAEDGSVYHMYLCSVCFAFEKKYNKEVWEDSYLEPGDFKEFDKYKEFKEQFLNQIYEPKVL